LTESAILALGGGVFALLLAAVAVRLLLRLQPSGIPRLEEVEIDGSVLIFTFFVALMAGLVSGVLAVTRATTPELVPALKEGGRSDTVGKASHRVRRILAAVQVALSLVLLIGAGLLGKSFWRLQSVNPGFNPRGVLTVFLTLPRTEYPDAQAVAHFVRNLREKIEALPGVRSAAMVSILPLDGGMSTSGYAIEDQPVSDEEARVSLGNQFVSPGYFEALGIPILAGKTFARLDPNIRQGEVVISRSVAERFWPGRNPLGKRLTPEEAREGEWYTIIGVVGDVHEAGLDKQPSQVVYFGWRRLANAETGEEHWVPPGGTLVVRTDGDPANLARPARDAIHAVDPALPVSQFRTMEEVVHRSMARSSFTLLMLAIAAAVALLLGTVGIYGIVAYIVSQRTREIGVRMALGARRTDIARLVLWDGLVLALLGVCAGLIVSLSLTRFMGSLLYKVSPVDPLIFSTVSVFLGLVTLCASWLPAQRAAEVEPWKAIRSE
jgi:putative ABC transport system permease protein